MRRCETAGTDALRGSGMSPPRDRGRQPHVRGCRAEQGSPVDGRGGGGAARGLLGLCPAGEFICFFFSSFPREAHPFVLPPVDRTSSCVVLSFRTSLLFTAENNNNSSRRSPPSSSPPSARSPCRRRKACPTHLEGSYRSCTPSWKTS